MSNGTKDNVLELCANVESQGWSYVLGIIKSDPNNKESDNLEIYTNSGEDCLDKLLKVLKDYKKTKDAKVIDKKKD